MGDGGSCSHTGKLLELLSQAPGLREAEKPGLLQSHWEGGRVRSEGGGADRKCSNQSLREVVTLHQAWLRASPSLPMESFWPHVLGGSHGGGQRLRTWKVTAVTD